MEDGGVNSHMLHFREDGVYSAYIVNEKDVEIPIYYKKELEFHHWIKIYDDNHLSFSCQANNIEIYRSGNFGCIIKYYD